MQQLRNIAAIVLLFVGASIALLPIHHDKPFTVTVSIAHADGILGGLQGSGDPAQGGLSQPVLQGQSGKPVTDKTGCFQGGVNFDLCITNIVYAFTAGIMSIFAYIGGVVFSVGVFFSLNSAAYALNFLSTGWAAIRDIANILFIFILIYLSFVIMFQAETSGTLRTLATVLVMALLVNFSFFVTRVVIDAGNILAVQFYNNINVATISASTSGATGIGLNTTQSPKDLTASIMDTIGLQKLFDTSTFNGIRAKMGGFVDYGRRTFAHLHHHRHHLWHTREYVLLCRVQVHLPSHRAVVRYHLCPARVRCPRAHQQRERPSFYKMWQKMLIQWAFYPAVFLFIFMLIVFFTQQLVAAPQLARQRFR
jgi:hypothetical protein